MAPRPRKSPRRAGWHKAPGVAAARLARQRRTQQREDDPYRGRDDNRTDDAPPERQQPHEAATENAELPEFGERKSERHGRSDDRADHGCTRSGQECLDATIGAQPVEMRSPNRTNRKDGANATTVARAAPASPAAA